MLQKTYLSRVYVVSGICSKRLEHDGDWLKRTFQTLLPSELLAYLSVSHISAGPAVAFCVTPP